MNTDDAPQRVHRIALLSTSDTDLLSARASLAAYKLGNPARQSIEAVLDGAEVVVLRVLGSSAEVADELSALRAAGLPLVVLGGERMPSAELMEQSSVPIGLAAQAHSYLAEGGPANLAQLHAFLCDTVLLTGQGFDEPVVIPEWGYAERAVIGTADVAARIGVLYYRAHEVSGNSGFAHALADAIEAAGTAVGVPIFASSLRSAPDELFDALATLDAVVISMLAAGGSKSASAGAGEDDASWDIERIAAMNIPVLQGLCLTSSRAEWESNDDGVTPLDSATQIAIPEFDGRIITAPYSFKEVDADGLPHYVAVPERCARVAAIAVKHALLRRVPNEQKKLALVLSAYPTKHSRVGNAVGLDTPASAVRLLRRLAQDGYDVGDGFGVFGIEDETSAGDRLMHTLIDAGGQDEQWLTTEQVADAQVKVTPAQYAEWTADLPARLRDAMADAWGPAPGRLFVNDDGDLVLAALRSGNIVLMIQPPRGFGENPVAIYHDPDLPPSHHYLAAYRWLEHGFGAHAVVHLGKHGSTEWLPGKNAALSAACATDAVLGNLPLIYPFLVNDPGEGAQAKRRAHATIVDHLIPPMARAESYGDIARLERLLDEYGNIAAMDPAKLPAIRGEIWNLMRAAEMHRDLGLDDRPDDAEFDDFLLHVDGWLCEIKDAQIRDGLHVLGEAPEGAPRVNLVLAILRAAQVWGGQDHAVPGLRTALARRGRRDRDPRTRAGRGHGGRRVGRRRRRRPARSARRAHGPAVRGDRGGTASGRHRRRAGRRLACARRRFRAPRSIGIATAGPGQCAAHGPQLLHRGPACGAVAAGLADRAGDGGVAAAALPRRHRDLPRVGRAVGVGHERDAHLRRRRG